MKCHEMPQHGGALLFKGLLCAALAATVRGTAVKIDEGLQFLRRGSTLGATFSVSRAHKEYLTTRPKVCEIFRIQLNSRCSACANHCCSACASTPLNFRFQANMQMHIAQAEGARQEMDRTEILSVKLQRDPVGDVRQQTAACSSTGTCWRRRSSSGWRSRG